MLYLSLSPLFLPVSFSGPFLPFSPRFPMVKRSAAEFLDDAEANVLDEDESHINGDLVPSSIVDATESLYAQMLGIWDE